MNISFFPDFNFSYLNISKLMGSHFHARVDALTQNEIYTYGGYGEDRKELLKDTYLKKNVEVIHLGLDIQVPDKTDVVSPFSADVVSVFKDYDQDLGWGTQIILNDHCLDLYWIIGHLGRTTLIPTQEITKGQIVGVVGDKNTNGAVFTHIHVQVHPYKMNWQEVDGYGSLDDLNNTISPLAALNLLTI